MLKKVCYLKGLTNEVAKVRPDWTIKRCEEAVRATSAGLESAIMSGYDTISFFRLFNINIKEPIERKGHPFNNPNLTYTKRKSVTFKLQRVLIRTLKKLADKDREEREALAKEKKEK